VISHFFRWRVYGAREASQGSALCSDRCAAQRNAADAGITGYEHQLGGTLSHNLQAGGGFAKGAGQIERLPRASLKNQIQRLTARVRQHKDRPSFVTSER
jgi:hypothetical protein